MVCIFVDLNATRKFYQKKNQLDWFIRQTIHFHIYLKRFAGMCGTRGSIDRAESWRFAKMLKNEWKRSYLFVSLVLRRYFIYGLQDAQHLERVRLEFSMFEIQKGEHKDKDKEWVINFPSWQFAIREMCVRYVMQRVYRFPHFFFYCNIPVMFW